MKTLQTYLNKLTPQQQREYAKLCGVSVNYLRTAVSRNVEFRTALCFDIEKYSNQEVRGEDLIPHADWEYIRDSAKKKAANES